MKILHKQLNITNLNRIFYEDASEVKSLQVSEGGKKFIEQKVLEIGNQINVETEITREMINTIISEINNTEGALLALISNQNILKEIRGKAVIKFIKNKFLETIKNTYAFPCGRNMREKKLDELDISPVRN